MSIRITNGPRARRTTEAKAFIGRNREPAFADTHTVEFKEAFVDTGNRGYIVALRLTDGSIDDVAYVNHSMSDKSVDAAYTFAKRLADDVNKGKWSRVIKPRVIRPGKFIPGEFKAANRKADIPVWDFSTKAEAKPINEAALDAQYLKDRLGMDYVENPPPLREGARFGKRQALYDARGSTRHMGSCTLCGSQFMSTRDHVTDIEGPKGEHWGEACDHCVGAKRKNPRSAPDKYGDRTGYHMSLSYGQFPPKAKFVEIWDDELGGSTYNWELKNRDSDVMHAAKDEFQEKYPALKGVTDSGIRDADAAWVLLHALKKYHEEPGEPEDSEDMTAEEIEEWQNEWAEEAGQLASAILHTIGIEWV